MTGLVFRVRVADPAEPMTWQWEGAWSSFAADNELSPAERAEVRARLVDGHTVVFGGGAAPVTEVWRVGPVWVGAAWGQTCTFRGFRLNAGPSPYRNPRGPHTWCVWRGATIHTGYAQTPEEARQRAEARALDLAPVQPEESTR